MALTNAERQRSYRDRKRGGPPRHRLNLGREAKDFGVSRTWYYMFRWVIDRYPELMGQLVRRNERRAGLLITPTYKRLKAKKKLPPRYEPRRPRKEFKTQ